MEKAFLHGKMVESILVIINLIKNMGTEYKYGPIIENMKDIGDTESIFKYSYFCILN